MRRGVARRRRSRNEAPRPGSRDFSGSGQEPRRSSLTRPDDASPRLRRATGCRAASSGWSCARSRERPCSSVSVRRLRPRRLPRTSRAMPHVSSSRRYGRPRRPGVPSVRGSPSPSGSSSSTSGFGRSSRRSPSRKAFHPLLARSRRRARGWRSRRSTSSRAPSERSPPRCALGLRLCSRTTPRAGSRSSNGRAARGSGASPSSRADHHRRSWPSIRSSRSARCWTSRLPP